MTRDTVMDAYIPAEPFENEPVGGAGLRQLYSAADTAPTRKVCEAVYFDAALRQRVLQALLLMHRRAWPPNYELDVTAIMRHAWRAWSWERRRDAAWCLVVLAALGSVALRLVNRGGTHLVAIMVTAILLAILTHRLLRWRRVTASAIRKRFWFLTRRNPLVVVIAVTTVLGLSATYVWRAVALVQLDDLLIVAAGLLTLIVIGVLHAASVSRQAERCRERGSIRGQVGLLRDAAPRLPAAFEKRLRAIDSGPEPDQCIVDEGNVIIFDIIERNRTAFINNVHVGSGASIGDFRINFDASKGRPNPDGSRAMPKKVNILALHRALAKYARERVPPGAWCGYRMYVDQRAVMQSGTLLPDMASGPLTRLPLTEHRRYLIEPKAFLRTHLCIQVPIAQWDGDVIVTLFIRGEMMADHLTLHNDVLILPNPFVKDMSPANYPPTDRWTRIISPLVVGTTAVWRTLPLAPSRLLREVGSSMRRRVYDRRIRWHLKHRRAVCYGSIQSMREQLAKGARVIHPYAIQDITGTVAFLQHTLKAALKQYLEGCDIDTSSLDDEVRNVIHNQLNKIEQLHAKNVLFGEGHAGDLNRGPQTQSEESQSRETP